MTGRDKHPDEEVEAGLTDGIVSPSLHAVGKKIGVWQALVVQHGSAKGEQALRCTQLSKGVQLVLCLLMHAQYRGRSQGSSPHFGYVVQVTTMRAAAGRWEGQVSVLLRHPEIPRWRFSSCQQYGHWPNSCPLQRNPHSSAGEGSKPAMVMVAELPVYVREETKEGPALPTASLVGGWGSGDLQGQWQTGGLGWGDDIFDNAQGVISIHVLV